LYDHRDPDGQLDWLVRVLAEAEADNEKVHILHHISPGHADCHRIWSREFSRIITRLVGGKRLPSFDPEPCNAFLQQHSTSLRAIKVVATVPFRN
jgi:hypothetical protein